MNWTDERCAELEKLRTLLREVAAINSGYGDERGHRPPYWWRKHLREAISQMQAGEAKHG